MFFGSALKPDIQEILLWAHETCQYCFYSNIAYE